MTTISISQDVSAPAARTWEILTDLDSAAQRISGIDLLERLGGPEFGVGTRWRETRTMLGKEATEEMEVTEVDPGSSYTVEAESHGTHYLSVIAVEDLGDNQSRLTMKFGAEPLSSMSKVMNATLGRLFVGATRKALAKDLAESAAAAEQPPS